MKKLSLFLVALTMLLLSCKPETEKPTVVTKSVGEMTETTAKVVGQVTADGGAEVTERGVCWNTGGTPTVLDYRVKDEVGGLGVFILNIPNLVPNTQYYVRVYATNEAGTSYGDEKNFTTLELTPEEPGDEPEEPGESISELIVSFNIYPNPVNDKLNIITEVEIEEVVVYDVYGRLQSTVNGQQPTVDVSDLNSGVYFVMIKTNEGVVTKRFVKE